MKIKEGFQYMEYLFSVNVLYSAIVNFRCFGIIGILKMPIIIQYGSVIIGGSKNSIVFLKPLQFNMLTIKSHSKFRIKKGGKIVFTGIRACFGRQNEILVEKEGTIEIGNKFWTNNYSEFKCRKSMKFGDNVLIAFHTLFIDTDYHPIFDMKCNIINYDNGIIIGNKVWIGCNTTIIKGSQIGDNIIIGACSLVTGNLCNENAIYCGIPAKLIKADVNWDVEHSDF